MDEKKTIMFHGGATTPDTDKPEAARPAQPAKTIMATPGNPPQAKPAQPAKTIMATPGNLPQAKPSPVAKTMMATPQNLPPSGQPAPSAAPPAAAPPAAAPPSPSPAPVAPVAAHGAAASFQQPSAQAPAPMPQPPSPSPGPGAPPMQARGPGGPGGPPPGGPGGFGGPGGPPPGGPPPGGPGGPGGFGGPGGPGAPPPMSGQNYQAMGSGHGGPTKKKIYMAVAGALALAVVGVVGAIVKNKVFGPKTAKGAISYARLDIDKKSAHVDQVIGSLESYARKRWRRDATWWSLNAYGVRPDGTMDLTGDGRAVIKFVSESGVQQTSRRKRKNSIKEYKATRQGVKSDKIISAKKPWKGFEPLPTPGCKIADLIAAASKLGFTDGTIRISFDPKFGFASGWNWRVFAKDKPYAGYYSMDDCSHSKKKPKKN